MSGSLKAAILLQSMDRQAADSILVKLGEEEKELIKQHLAQLDNVSPEVVERVAKEFTDLALRVKAVQPQLQGPGGSRLLPEKGSVPAEELPKGLEAILSLKADEIFELVKGEHPQTIAIVLIHLETGIASDILSMLPDEIKTDVAVRIANMDKVVSTMVEEVNAVFKEILKNKQNAAAGVSGGVAHIAEILNQTDAVSTELILSEIEEADGELAAEIKQKMFVFEDLVLVDDRGFQKLLRQVETGELAVALKAASDEVKEKVFKNMSERAGDMLREEMEDLGPVRMTEVIEAQENITTIIQGMESKGEIIIRGRGGDEIIV